MENESSYTRASSFCPHPEYYHSPDSEATEDEVSDFIAGLVRIIQPEYVVETGTYHGDTTVHIASALFDNGHGKIVSIEKDRDAHDYAKAHQSWGYTNSLVTLLNMNTMDFVPEQDIDFAFFDSWQEGRREEFLRYHALGFIKPGAIVAFHDSAPHHQVWKGIQSLIDDGYLQGIQFHNPRGLFVAQVLK